MRLPRLGLYRWLFVGIGIFLLFSSFLLQTPPQSQVISLAGEWKFRTDPSDKGVEEKWFAATLPETVRLPGSMLENDKGDEVTLQTKWTGSIYDSSWYFNPRLAKYRQPGNVKFPFWLTPAKYYVGAAWYQKEVIIPENWQGQRLVLSLERAHTETRLWVDNVEVGMQNSMVVAHEYDLTGKLLPGKHLLTLRIDNRIKDINVGPDSHSLTDHTQGNWNGIIGKMELTASAPYWFDDMQVYPDVARKKAKVKLRLKSALPKPASGQLTLRAKSYNSASVHEAKPLVANVKFNAGEAILELEYPLGSDVQLWDEFNPALYRLTATFTTKKGVSEEKSIQFGMREFTINGTRFEVNGRPVFLRGTVNNCEFPLTGYPPMDAAAWEKQFRTAKAHGLNHMRFHSWCPPEAAFIAADKVGFYLQPEGPSWANHGISLGDGKPIDQFIYDETNRMAKVYGNYASFCMLAYGNEPKGGKQAEYLAKFVKYWMEKDARRKYTGASVGMSWPLVPENEYMVKSGPRGLDWSKRPESMGDYRAKIEKFNLPYVAHEMGQWCVFPNFKEIKKYTGLYKAKNFELFQEDLQDHHMGDQAEAFTQASGELQALCYKAEIETALRTPGFAGFQLLGLNDFPGQGTALVGVLDAFWEEKGYISPQEFSRFCNSTVPLARLPKFVFRNDETLSAQVEVAHFGAASLQHAKASWKARDTQGKEVAKGSFDAKTIPIGNNIPLGTINLPLSNLTQATRLNLEVVIENTAFANDWNVWVYPANLPDASSKDVYFCTELDSKAEQILQKGGKVFLQAPGKVEKGKEVVQYFTPVFWNTSWFKMRPPHTTGILCDPKHPAFANFPTDFHSNLQWWELVNRASVMHLEDFPAGFRPLVQPIDTWFLNRRLALVLEANVGKGKLLISSLDLTSEPEKRPAARQLLYSLQRYTQSEQFNPKESVDLAVIKALFSEKSKEQFNAYTKDSPDELKPKPVNK